MNHPKHLIPLHLHNFFPLQLLTPPYLADILHFQLNLTRLFVALQLQLLNSLFQHVQKPLKLLNRLHPRTHPRPNYNSPNLPFRTRLLQLFRNKRLLRTFIRLALLNINLSRNKAASQLFADVLLNQQDINPLRVYLHREFLRNYRLHNILIRAQIFINLLPNHPLRVNFKENRLFFKILVPLVEKEVPVIYLIRFNRVIFLRDLPADLQGIITLPFLNRRRPNLRII